MLQLIVRWLQRRSDSTLALLTRLLFSRSWRRFLEAVHDPRAAQEARLFEILARNKDTVFGKEHDFAGIDSSIKGDRQPATQLGKRFQTDPSSREHAQW